MVMSCGKMDRGIRRGDPSEDYLAVRFIDRVFRQCRRYPDGHRAPRFSLAGRAATGKPGVLGYGDRESDDLGELIDREPGVGQGIGHGLRRFDRPEIFILTHQASRHHLRADAG
jgi:hypothetical protein